MALETGTYISDLIATNPTASDNISNGDDHLRLLKATIKASFPNVTGAMTRTHTELNNAVTLAGTETLTNKTLTNPFVNTAITVTPKTGTNLAGDNLTLIAGNGTGTGGSGYIAFQTAAAGTTGSTANTLTERMRIDNAGNVGIGTTPSVSSARLLQISGSSVIGSINNNINIAANAVYDNAWKYVSSSTATRYTQSNGTHSWAYAASGTAGNAISFTEGMLIDSSGNVGIGTASPSAKLNVVGTTNTANFEGSIQGGINIQKSGTNGIQLYSGAAGTLGFFDANSTLTRMFIDSSGNVGIGTASPSYQLDILGSASIIRVKDSGASGASAFVNTKFNATAGLAAFQTSGDMVLATNGAERTRIDSSGYTYETNAVNTQSTAATLTAAQVLGGILVTSPSGAITLTMPTGTDLDAVFPNTTGMTRDLTVVNTTANVVTIAANTGVTLTGGMQPTSSNPCLFRLRRTGSATYTMYRAG